MNSQNKYLTNKNPNFEDGIQKIKWLLESTHEGDVELAFSLMKGGGVHQQLLTHLLAISFFHHDEQMRKRARRVYKMHASAPLYNHTKQKWRYNYRYSYDEIKMTEFLQDMASHQQISGKEMSNLALKFIHKGGKYCLENDTAPKEHILRMLSRQDRLSLAYFQLRELPAEIGQLTNLISLHIGGNLFTEIPDELQNLKNLTQLYHKNTPLSENALQKLENFFPQIFAQQLLRDVQRLLQQHKHYQKALMTIYRACKLTPEDSGVWTVKGQVLTRLKRYEEALRSLQFAIELNPKNIQAWTQKIFTLRRIGRLREALQLSNQALSIFEGVVIPSTLVFLYEQKAKTLYRLKQYEEALQEYEKTVLYQPQNVRIHYHIAKVASKLDKKEIFLQALQNIAKLKPEFLQVIKNNPAFMHFHSDEAIKAMLH